MNDKPGGISCRLVEAARLTSPNASVWVKFIAGRNC